MTVYMESKVKKFNKNQSVLKDVYIAFSVNDPGELQDLYMSEDQKLMKVKKWDYNDSNLIPSKIKNMIEEIGISNITDKKEEQWIQNILWMWYHHATSCALWRHEDKKAAMKYSEIALKLQPNNHPNKITRLLYFLIRDEIENAEKWTKSITKEPEKTAAQYNIELYKKGDFFKLQV